MLDKNRDRTKIREKARAKAGSSTETWDLGGSRISSKISMLQTWKVCRGWGRNKTK